MISALVGAVIMSGVTVAMLLAISVSDDALKQSGKYPLTKNEEGILRDAGLVEKIESINDDINLLRFEKEL